MRFFLRHFLNLIKGLKRNDRLVVFFTFFYLVFFILYAIARSNYEFIFYSLIFLLLIELVIYIHKQIKLPAFIVIGLSLLGFMHILGGNIFIDGVRLYDKIFLLGLIRYDNLVHIIGSILGTFVLHELFCFLTVKETIIERRLYYLSLLLMGFGVGLINEIVELVAVVFLNAQDGVGDYLNNAIDLIYNSIGVIIAVIFLDLNFQYRIGKLNKLQKAVRFIKIRILGRS
ncbi:MAG: DUF2238 domain-containing protein [bacterium]|nr:DUF2238 domain-containing protein [bacterium]